MKNDKKTNPLLWPFKWIYSFIRHFFIGFKFVFYDSFVSIFSYFKNKERFKSLENISSINSNININNTESNILSIEERQRIAHEKQELVLEMQKEASVRQVRKEYYTYYGIDNAGHKVTGTLKAFSKVSLYDFLATMNINVYSIKKDKLPKHNKALSQDTLILILNQINGYIKSGVSLNDTFKFMINQTLDKDLQRLYYSIAYELSLGRSLSEAMNNQDGIFPPLLIQIINDCSDNRKLISALEDMIKYYEQDSINDINIKSINKYPLMIILFILIVITSISYYLTLNLNIIIIDFIILIIILILFKIDTIRMKLPIYDKIIIYHEIAKLGKTLKIIYKYSLNINNSLIILPSTTNNEVFKQFMDSIKQNMLKTKSLAISFRNKWFIPKEIYLQLASAEASGNIIMMLDKIDKYYQELCKSYITKYQSYLNLFIIIILLAIIILIIPLLG